jgi:hypothetical protein
MKIKDVSIDGATITVVLTRTPDYQIEITNSARSGIAIRPVGDTRHLSEQEDVSVIARNGQRVHVKLSSEDGDAKKSAKDLTRSDKRNGK